MKKINHRDVKEKEVKSPHGRYHLHRKFLTLHLGGKSDVGPWGGGHPFDLELTRLPPGAMNFPLHQHSAQWEMYIVLSGTGEVNDGREWKPIKAGDVFVAEPEQPHQLRNNGKVDLTYYVIATNQQADVTFYNETGRWGIKPQKKHFVMQEVEYYQPED
jgi:uncharacterized cupin superfamily protein